MPRRRESSKENFESQKQQLDDGSSLLTVPFVSSKMRDLRIKRGMRIVFKQGVGLVVGPKGQPNWGLRDIQPSIARSFSFLGLKICPLLTLL